MGYIASQLATYFTDEKCCRQIAKVQKDLNGKRLLYKMNNLLKK